jgi:hypothetical protein
MGTPPDLAQLRAMNLTFGSLLVLAGSLLDLFKRAAL